jgi:hypothetical protein
MKVIKKIMILVAIFILGGCSAVGNNYRVVNYEDVRAGSAVKIKYTKKGRVITGEVIEITSTSLKLRSSKDGKEYLIPPNFIARIELIPGIYDDNGKLIKENEIQSRINIRNVTGYTIGGTVLGAILGAISGTPLFFSNAQVPIYFSILGGAVLIGSFSTLDGFNSAREIAIEQIKTERRYKSQIEEEKPVKKKKKKGKAKDKEDDE